MKLHLAIIILFLWACSYEPSGEFFNNITPPDGSSSFVDLGTQTDPISIFAPTTFNFQVKPTNLGPYAVTVKLDDIVLLSANNSYGYFSFTIDPALYTDGAKVLTITAGHLSNSKSLAGQLQVEGIIFSRTHRVIINNIKPDKIPAPNVAIEDGKLMIHWTAPTNDNFQNLVIVRTYELGLTDQIDTLKPTSNNITFYHDQSYVGGDVSYSVDLKSRGSYIKGNERYFSCVPITVSYDPIAGRVSWPKPLLYGNNVDLIIDYFGRAERAPASSEGGYDTYVRFGESKVETIAVNPVTPPNYNYHASQFQYIVRTKVFKGMECPPLDRAIYVPTNNSYLIIKDGKASQVNSSTFSTSFSSELYIGNMMMSDNSENAYIWNGNFLSKGIGLHRWSPSSLGIIVDYDLKSIFPGAVYPGLGSFATVTNNNLLAANFPGTLSSSSWNILDMNSQSVIWEGQTSFKLSPDGNFMLKDNAVYTRGNNTWNSLVGTIIASEQLVGFVFRQSGGVNILYASASSGALYIFNLNGSVNGNGELPKISHTLPLSSGGYNYDRFTNSLYSITNDNGGQVNVYDADSFQVKTIFSSISEANKVTYENGSLFHQNGFVIPK